MGGREATVIYPLLGPRLTIKYSCPPGLLPTQSQLPINPRRKSRDPVPSGQKADSKFMAPGPPAADPPGRIHFSP